MFKKYVLLIFTAVVHANLVAANSYEEKEKSIEFTVGDLHRCKTRSSTDSLALCYDESGYKDDIFSAMSRCETVSQQECTAEIAKFKDQISLRQPALQYQNLFYVGNSNFFLSNAKLFGKRTDQMLPIELAVAAGMHNAVAGLLANGANPSFQQALYPKLTLLHHLAYQAINNRDLQIAGFDKNNLEIELNGQSLPWGPSYTAREDNYLKIAKLLITKAGSSILTKVDYAGDISAKSCGEIPGKVCDYLRRISPKPKIISAQTKSNQIIEQKPVKPIEDPLERNKRAVAARAKQYQKCSWSNAYYAYNKNKLNNDQFLDLLDAGYTICE